MVRSMVVVCGLIVSQLAPVQATAATIRFGYSGLHALPSATYEAMSVDARRAYLESRSALANTLGADALRTGDAAPLLLERAAPDDIDWTALDHAVGVTLSAGVEVCVTLPEVPTMLEQPAFNAFVATVLERYDGDLDFGVDPLDLNRAYPDINGSGSITDDDWDASSELRLAWAAAHQLRTLEVGQRVRHIEDTRNLGANDYANQLSAVVNLAKSANETMSVMLGSVWVHEDSQQRFVSRLESLDAEAKALIMASNVAVYGEFTTPEVSDGIINLEKFDTWLVAAGLADTERWVGGLSVPAAANGDSGGPCEDDRCSERTQVAGLVRLTIASLRAGYTTLLYERPVEVVGEGVAADAWTASGLLVLELFAGIDLTVLPLRPRPAYAVWRWLQSTFAEVTAVDFATLHDTPPGVSGVAVADGWLLWFDWFAEAAQGVDYAGEERPVILTGLTSPSLRVQSLWPGSVGAQLSDEGQVEVAWTETLVPVIDGAAQIMVGEDPVWVEASEALIEPDGEPAPDAGSSDDASSAEEDTSAGPEADTEPAPPEEGGCTATEHGQGWMTLVGLLCAWMLRRRSCPTVRTR